MEPKMKMLDHHKIEEENISATQQGWTSQRPSSLTTIDKMKASNLQEVFLLRSSAILLYIHKLQLWTCIAPKYYDERHKGC